MPNKPGLQWVETVCTKDIYTLGFVITNTIWERPMWLFLKENENLYIVVVWKLYLCFGLELENELFVITNCNTTYTIPNQSFNPNQQYEYMWSWKCSEWGHISYFHKFCWLAECMQCDIHFWVKSCTWNLKLRLSPTGD